MRNNTRTYNTLLGHVNGLLLQADFDLEYAVSSLSIFSAEPWVCHIDMARRIFGYLKKYPKTGYEINPQPLNVDADYEKVQMKYDFVYHYA